MNFLANVAINRALLVFTSFIAIVYFISTAFFFTIGNVYLFALLILCGMYHLFQVLGYIHGVWPRIVKRIFNPKFKPEVAIFITVCGEPTEIIEETLQAVLKMDYPSFNVYILNDGFVAKRENWREPELLAKKYKVTCITREIAGGAKAGNINNAMRATTEPFIAVFDADHVPKSSFLNEMVGHFADQKVGFVQSPQYYKNYELNMVTSGSWEQQALFFGAIMKGKNGTNTVFMCGTNMMIRREAIDMVGGMNETNIAEDFLTSLLIHEQGWKSVYVDKVLAKGLAPEDFLSYYKQQFRWARGSLEIVFKYNPFFRKGLTFAQRLQYLTSASYYLSGVVVAINAILPLIYFFVGIEPLKINTMTLTLVFLPYMFSVLYNIQLTSNFSYTFRALCFSLASFPIHLQAVYQILTGKKTGFAVTSKTALTGNFAYLVTPHFVYIALVILGVGVAFLREGLSSGLFTNLTWAAIYIAVFIPFINAATEQPKNDEVSLDIAVPELSKN